MTCRISKLQEEYIDGITMAFERQDSNLALISKIMNMRDFNGRSINTLLLETKVYKLLQVRVIETAIR